MSGSFWVFLGLIIRFWTTEPLRALNWLWTMFAVKLEKKIEPNFYTLDHSVLALKLMLSMNTGSASWYKIIIVNKISSESSGWKPLFAVVNVLLVLWLRCYWVVAICLCCADPGVYGISSVELLRQTAGVWSRCLSKSSRVGVGRITVLICCLCVCAPQPFYNWLGFENH